ncbi:hypothetical protein [Lusitaniella coriacea]|uniref:hypothetical protein n=1 Tax=Lusitaniella coriacea TaxID=1983105 RepID=UPI003CF64163
MSRSPYIYNREKRLDNNRRDFSAEEETHQSIMVASRLETRDSEERSSQITRTPEDDFFETRENNRVKTPNEAAQNNMKSWWNRIVQQASQDENCSPQAWEKEQIKNALGRPVLREIFDENNERILDVGDLITYRAIERAKNADVLDLLMSSVYENDSDLSSFED